MLENELLMKLIVTLIASIVFLILLFFTVRSAYRRRANEAFLIDLEVSDTGMVHVTEDMITSCYKDYEQKFIFFKKIPKELWKYVDRHTSGSINGVLLEYMALEDGEARKNIARIMTVVSAYFKISVPLNLICMDVTTLQFYRALISEMEIVYPSLEDDEDYDTGNFRNALIPKEIYSLYLREAKSIGGYLIFCAASGKYTGSYPSLENLWKAYYKARKTAGRDCYNIDEMKMIVTIYARITETCLPRSYCIELNPVVAASVEAFKNKHPQPHRQLNLVK